MYSKRAFIDCCPSAKYLFRAHFKCFLHCCKRCKRCKWRTFSEGGVLTHNCCHNELVGLQQHCRTTRLSTYMRSSVVCWHTACHQRASMHNAAEANPSILNCKQNLWVVQRCEKSFSLKLIGNRLLGHFVRCVAVAPYNKRKWQVKMPVKYFSWPFILLYFYTCTYFYCLSQWQRQWQQSTQHSLRNSPVKKRIASCCTNAWKLSWRLNIAPKLLAVALPMD